MKIYKFFKVPEKDSTKKKYLLYAFTGSKEYANIFMEERDMKQFIKRVEDIDKEDYREFANENRSLLLEKNRYSTKGFKNDLIIEDYSEIVSTDYELQTVKDSSECSDIHTEEWWSLIGDYTYKMFNNEIIEALSVLEYISTYKLFSGEARCAIDGDFDDYSAPDIKPDEVSVFIRLYGSTFK